MPFFSIPVGTTELITQIRGLRLVPRCVVVLDSIGAPQQAHAHAALLSYAWRLIFGILAPSEHFRSPKRRPFRT